MNKIHGPFTQEAGWVEYNLKGYPLLSRVTEVDVRLEDGSVELQTNPRGLNWANDVENRITHYRVNPVVVDRYPKQERYHGVNGEDWIDECARTLTAEEFRGAMKFTIGKYIRRLGRKDTIVKEVKKIADYAQRWEAYENTEGRQNNSESDTEVRD